MTADDSPVLRLERPHSNLLLYYCLTSFVLGPFFFIVLLPLVFKYQTLRYQFDSEGVSMRWGVLFRREISLTYSRLQDIHLSSNLVERWLGLAKVQLQTASGSAAAEMTIEGFQEFEAIRDFLYTRMRGARGFDRARVRSGSSPGGAGVDLAAAEDLELGAALRSVAEELRQVRSLLADRLGGVSAAASATSARSLAAPETSPSPPPLPLPSEDERS